MKIFVTGGAGFVGKNLVKELAKNNSITVYDNFSSKLKPITDTNAKIVRGDVTDYKKLAKYIKDHKVVIHLAARISVQESMKQPELVNQTNVDGTVNVLKACVENKVNNVIFASSAAVYGDTNELPISEKAITNPVSPYGASKLASEYYVKAFSNCFGINAISLRMFNIYGEGQSPEYAGVITKFAESLSKNKSLTVFGDGSQTRDFVNIKDVVNAVKCAIKNIAGKKGETYNIASGKFVSINRLAELMINLSKKKVTTKHVDERIGDIKHSQCKITRAKKDLGYSPGINLKQGLRNFLESSNPS